jgi:hypothetical protein
MQLLLWLLIYHLGPLYNVNIHEHHPGEMCSLWSDGVWRMQQDERLRDIVPCSLGVNRLFRGAYCPKHQDDEFLMIHGAIPQKTPSLFSPPWEPEISQRMYCFCLFQVSTSTIIQVPSDRSYHFVTVSSNLYHVTDVRTKPFWIRLIWGCLW